MVLLHSFANLNVDSSKIYRTFAICIKDILGVIFTKNLIISKSQIFNFYFGNTTFNKMLKYTEFYFRNN